MLTLGGGKTRGQTLFIHIREVKSYVWNRAMIVEYKDIKKKRGLS
jgi:hypothetical protein